ncbi:MAG: isoleucine--tRNA ligase [Candidatus Omnitrophota bacterium]
MNYKDTLNLPKTTFSMKANLLQKEPAMLKAWDEKNMYSLIRKSRKGERRMVLHDGPPYANGHIHMGHVLNKLLKDIVVKFYSMKGYDSPFVPGWDCHGLPVEHQLLKELKLSKYHIDQVKFRKDAREYALKFVKIQKKEFKRLGIFADWENPYLTLDTRYEACILRSFAKLVKEGYIYKDLKPVNWCTTCETALAEAEVEYESHESPSIYVKFRLRGENSKRCFVIWTTTPWTLLGNAAIAIHPDMDYSVLEVGAEEWVMLEELAPAIMEKLKKPLKVIKKQKGSSFEGVVCEHPFIDRVSKVVFANYVSSLEGTGCVHTAPGHGQEDYATGKRYSLPMIMPVDAKGSFDETCGEFSKLDIHKANPKIVEHLKKIGALVASENIRHSYPHCWRCKKPIITRATEQYFSSIDHKNLRTNMLSVIKNEVKWHPKTSEGRISSMVKNRPDWCLSRQRYWGVPIIAFKCKKCDTLLLDHKIIEHVAGIVEKSGTDAWFIKNIDELLPKGVKCSKCGGEELEKEKDILDVWFESGVSYSSVLKEKEKLGFPCELYLEGSDQHRGWFQSSLIISCAIEGRAPYKNVLTHGFVVDSLGRKMSKSVGNVISPQEAMKKYGADILRLWVASSNYQEDVRLSDEVLKGSADAYRKIRNTFKYLLGNINDFNPDKDKVEKNELEEIDRWMLSRLGHLIAATEKNYSEYMFYKIFRALYNFCIYEISSLYLDILKDRLYTFAKDSKARRSAQTVLFEIFNALTKLLAPILSFTTEEAYAALGRENESIHQSQWDWNEDTLKKWQDNALDEKWGRLLQIREEVLKALEQKRISGLIGSGLESKIILYADKELLGKFLKENEKNLTTLLMTSKTEVSESEPEDAVKFSELQLWVAVKKADGEKCPRCWNYRTTVGRNKEFPELCQRCADVIKQR